MKRLVITELVFIILASLIFSCTQGSKKAPIISRQVLFGNPDKTHLKISPDGRKISYLAPLDGVMNIWVAPADDPSAAVPVTSDTLRGINNFFWAITNNHIVYLQDMAGDENWQVHAVNLKTKEDKNLTPFEEIIGDDGNPVTLPSGDKMKPTAQIQEVSYKYSDEILIALNNRNPQYHDIHRLNILTGEMKLIQQNDQFMGFLSDDDYYINYALKMTPDGGNEIFTQDGKGGWKSFDKIPMEDMLTTMPIAFDKSMDLLYMIDSRGRNTAALISVDSQTGDKKVLFEDPRADVSETMIHPIKKTIEAAASNYTRIEWKILDESIQPDFDYLKTVADGDMNVLNRSLDDNVWAVSFVMDNGPVRYYLYNRFERNARFMFTNRKELEGLTLSKMHPVIIKSRDGLNLIGYLTLPHWTDPDNDASPDEPLPMVLFVHGGPWSRDSWGFNPFNQFLSNRGYAVLRVNYRGSTGFGKDFINAGNLEWGGKMHDDMIDSVNWAIKEGIADKEKIAIFGGSYGGYATLVGLTVTPDIFACGVDICGPTNLQTFLETLPPYYEPYMNIFTSRIGDHRTEEGRKFLASISPLNNVDKINKPLLISQGVNDPRVIQNESDMMVKAIRENNIPVSYILYPDEGHGFGRPENILSFNAVMDLFLAEHLGGRSEPIGDDFEGSTIKLPTGAEHIPTLKESLDN